MTYLHEIYCKIAITGLLIAVFAINHPPDAIGNGLKVLAVVVVAVLALYISSVSRGHGSRAGKPFAYLLAIAALAGILWKALAVR
jgi:hypothetical protein